MNGKIPFRLVMNDGEVIEGQAPRDCLDNFVDDLTRGEAELLLEQVTVQGERRDKETELSIPAAAYVSIEYEGRIES